jgi:hypothetical protein
MRIEVSVTFISLLVYNRKVVTQSQDLSLSSGLRVTHIKLTYLTKSGLSLLSTPGMTSRRRKTSVLKDMSF